MQSYKDELLSRYWAYQKEFFPNFEALFDPKYHSIGSPPVFLVNQAWQNVIVNPSASEVESRRLLASVPSWAHHKWFRSMNSSQALAQSVLGNLAIHDQLNCLSDLSDDAGETLLGEANTSPGNFSMEHKVAYLGEPHSTSLDAFFSGSYQVAVECKFTEAEFGGCSHTLPKVNASGLVTIACNGEYAHQNGHVQRCVLAEKKVKYWDYVPYLFDWRNDVDLVPCPLNKNYQLVRNVLSACVRNGIASPEHGHALVLYDERNPAFQAGGKALAGYTETRDALQVPQSLRKCSWQRLIGHLRDLSILPWLTDSLRLKYGL